MADKDVERIDERDHGSEPWWAGLGTRGAVTLIVVGVLAAAWAVVAPALGLRWLPLTPENLATGVYQGAKVVAIGVVILVGAVLTRRRAGTPAEPERD
ncbi:hypothetical protein [Streptomyces chartreusis]|uniref:Uncharacterized protein n=1 Tax=Streptomyces chartreusis TaxID=1969 RepID=A0A7H8TJP9_STRCX|nr:hypothetical protein [Streptomyces chartreusis]QKZ23741.1 hypothetical protein HUT05_44135 [Streptomyces chartreusis]